MGLTIFGFLQAYSYPLAIVSRHVFSFVAAFWISGSNSLALGQVPEYRGAMMSLNSGFFQLGIALGSAIGGLIITIGGYTWMGVFMGVVGVLASIVVLLLAIDPVSNIG
jgi:predicted MFS family arabinose efflux permease